MSGRAKMVRMSWMAGALLPLLAGLAGAARTNSTLPQMAAAFPYSYNPYTVTTFHGTVSKIVTGHVPGTSVEGDAIAVSVQADNGMKIHVDLGPRSFVESQGMFLPPGTSVTVTGSPAYIAGTYIFLATRIQTPYRVFRVRAPDGKPLWELDRSRHPNYDHRGYDRYDPYAYPYRH
jgi:hypothetical protein